MHIEVEQISTLYPSNLSQNGNKLIEERICTPKNKLHSHEQFPSWKGLAIQGRRPRWMANRILHLFLPLVGNAHI